MDRYIAFYRLSHRLVLRTGTPPGPPLDIFLERGPTAYLPHHPPPAEVRPSPRYPVRCPRSGPVATIIWSTLALPVTGPPRRPGGQHLLRREGKGEHTRSKRHQSRKGRENIPVRGTNRGRGGRIYP
eukprot:1187825-Prorocentrum_minimum.AAC.3